MKRNKNAVASVDSSLSSVNINRYIVGTWVQDWIE